VMNTTLVLAAPFLGVAVGVLAGSYPAIRAARITPMAALRA
jgi:putative ABC transport system permease protein